MFAALELHHSWTGTFACMVATLSACNLHTVMPKCRHRSTWTIKSVLALTMKISINGIKIRSSAWNFTLLSACHQLVLMVLMAVDGGRWPYKNFAATDGKCVRVIEWINAKDCNCDCDCDSAATVLTRIISEIFDLLGQKCQQRCVKTTNNEQPANDDAARCGMRRALSSVFIAWDGIAEWNEEGHRRNALLVELPQSNVEWIRGWCWCDCCMYWRCLNVC